VSAINAADCIKSITLLLQHGAQLNARDGEGRTVLHQLSSGLGHAEKRLEVARFVVDKGADYNCRDNSGITPLYLAILNDSGPIADWLISLVPNVQCVDSYGISILHRATGMKSAWALRICQLLLLNGADPYSRDNYKNKTPLEWAESELAERKYSSYANDKYKAQIIKHAEAIIETLRNPERWVAKPAATKPAATKPVDAKTQSATSNWGDLVYLTPLKPVAPGLHFPAAAEEPSGNDGDDDLNDFLKSLS
jgi:hypothetical protein